MARGPNKKAAEAECLYRSGMKLLDIAHKLELPEGTVRRWKSTYKWESGQSERSDKKKANVRIKEKHKKKDTAKEVREVVENSELTDKQQLFCLFYVRCFNATKAYQKAYGVDYTTAASISYRLLGNEKVKQEILRLKQERLNREFFSEEDIFQKYMDIAFADMTDYMEIKNGAVHLKDSNGFDGTLVKKVASGKTDSIELQDRMKALQWLSDHMDLATTEQKIRIEKLKADSNLSSDSNDTEVKIYLPDNGRDMHE